MSGRELDYGIVAIPAHFWCIIFILFMIMNNNAAANSGGSKMMKFGKSRAKLSTEEDNKMSFANVAGLREEKRRSRRIG